jgi:hypothetical protein
MQKQMSESKDCFEQFDGTSKICTDGCFKHPECYRASLKKNAIRLQKAKDEYDEAVKEFHKIFGHDR